MSTASYVTCYTSYSSNIGLLKICEPKSQIHNFFGLFLATDYFFKKIEAVDRMYMLWEIREHYKVNYYTRDSKQYRKVMIPILYNFIIFNTCNF